MKPEKSPFINKKSAPLLLICTAITALVIISECLNYTNTGKLINVNIQNIVQGQPQDNDQIGR